MQVTDETFNQVRAMLEDKGMTLDDHALRVAVEDGGCSGRQYVIKFDQPQFTDIQIEKDGVKVVIDPASHELLKDSEVDYSDALADRGFKIRNPLAKRSCGCGKSFEA